MDNNLKFEILALNRPEQSSILSECELLYSLRSKSLLWKTPSFDETNLRITENTNTLEVKGVKANTGIDEEFSKYAEPSQAFLVTVTGNSDWLEPKRKLIVEFLQQQKFNHLYVLIDQVSEQIACEIYPLIYKVENLLRAYIVKFMTTRMSPKWWDDTATNDLKQKVKDRKNNEKEFAEYIDNKIYLIDFSDVGKLIYFHSTGFTSKEDIISKISEIEETPEAIRKLKQEIQTNYQRFFKDSFKNKNFQQKWEELEKIRHKVAHNNLFTNSDLEKGKQLAKELLEIIDTAIKSVDEVTLRPEEVEAIQESFPTQESFTEITEGELLTELREQEGYYSNRPNAFVSLSRFVTIHLSGKSYSVPSTYRLVKELEAQQKVEVYYVDNPYNQAQKTAAIRIAQPTAT
ncbi:Swt1 family HEPN domain-containing protein [Microcoleus sp. POL10_C6]|uniref:Swt1 family HEPN domain-containing protein n=1 Tax=unclassified Microcoleus TaxID=2642155 RepID=UPI002FCFD5E6